MEGDQPDDRTQQSSATGSDPVAPPAEKNPAPKDEPDAAPVNEVKPEKTIPLVAPVSDVRATQGVELTKKLLNILTGSIVILVIYLWFLDSRTSDKVDQLYVNAFKAIALGSPAISQPQIVFLIDRLKVIEKNPKAEFPPGTSKKMKSTFAQLSSNFPFDSTDVESLESCIEKIKDSSPTVNETLKTSPAEPTVPAHKVDDSGAAPMIPADGDPSSDISGCVDKLESFRHAAAGPIETDRLRLMRDFAKDMQENHQGLRTFWLSATQLILVNVLLPLLTALLGYIFGRQSAS